MGWIMPEMVLQKIISSGIKGLRNNRTAFNDLFEQYTCSDFTNEYGEDYLEQLWTWFSTTKIPVVQAWSFNAQKIPCISIQLANETEDESKAALSDYAGSMGEDADLLTGVFTVMIDIGIHASKQGDQVLWLYYIISYILFKNKPMAERLGLKLHTFTASDYNKESKYMAENIWTRWIRFRCTTQNFLGGEDFFEVEDVNVDMAVMLDPASSISASDDVNIDDIDNTANDGMWVSRISDPDGDEDELI